MTKDYFAKHKPLSTIITNITKKISSIVLKLLHCKNICHNNLPSKYCKSFNIHLKFNKLSKYVLFALGKMTKHAVRGQFKNTDSADGWICIVFITVQTSHLLVQNSQKWYYISQKYFLENWQNQTIHHLPTETESGIEILMNRNVTTKITRKTLDLK